MNKALRFSAAFSLVVVLAAALAVMALWAFNASSGTGENARISTNVEWKVFGADGILKSQGVRHNITAGNLLEAASDRLSAAATVAAGDIFANISACSTAQTGITANNGTATAACTLSSNIGTNPVLATISDLAENGNYTAVTTFTASGASTISELELSKNLVASTAPAVGDIGAVQAVTITLASGDTLAVTWTIDID